MRVGVRVPQYGGSWPEIRAAAERIAARGFDGIWVNDHLQSPGRVKHEPTFEGLTTLAALAPLVPRVRLGVAVLSASYRPAPLAVRMTSVIDAIGGGGRMVVGLGTGSDVAEHRAYGIPFADRATRTRRLHRAVRVFRAMQAHPDGATVDDAIVDAPNRPNARPPVWLAAHRPRLLEYAGREADGIIAAFVDPATFDTRLRTALTTRPDSEGDFAACLYTFVMPLVSEAETWLAPEAEALGTTPRAALRWLRTTGLVAPPDELRDLLAEYATVGATDAVLALPSRTPPELIDAVADMLGYP